MSFAQISGLQLVWPTPWMPFVTGLMGGLRGKTLFLIQSELFLIVCSPYCFNNTAFKRNVDIPEIVLRLILWSLSIFVYWNSLTYGAQTAPAYVSLGIIYIFNMRIRIPFFVILSTCALKFRFLPMATPRFC